MVPTMNATSTQASRLLVSVRELEEHLADPNWVIVDCRFNLVDTSAGLARYRAGHIPGAHYANLDCDLAGTVAAAGAGGRHPLPSVAQLGDLARRWCLHPDSRIVAYDDAGGAIAARLWWLLRDGGHAQVAVLDGGWDAWCAASLVQDTHLPQTGSGTWQPKAGNCPVIGAEDLSMRLAARDCVLLDARAPDRYAGKTEPLDRRAGHVPGAINAPFSNNLAPDKCFRVPRDLQAYYSAILGTPLADSNAPELICMCGSGVTACHTILALAVAGAPRAILYTGSWSDWISDPSRPIAMDRDSS